MGDADFSKSWKNSQSRDHPGSTNGKELEMIPDGAFFEVNPSRSYRLRPATPEEIAHVGPFDDGLTAYIVAARSSAGERFKSYLFTWRESRHGPLSGELEDETAAESAWNNLRVPPPRPAEHHRSGTSSGNRCPELRCPAAMSIGVLAASGGWGFKAPLTSGLIARYLRANLRGPSPGVFWGLSRTVPFF
jgi:hypothetical protein